MKKLLSAILTAAIIVSSVFAAKDIFRIKRGEAKYKDFYENTEKYDILFTGSSVAVMGFLPMDMWREYGISGYNLGNFGQLLPTDYWLLKEVFTQYRPKLLVADIYSIVSDEKYSQSNLPFLHEAFDRFGYSKIKKAAIADLLPDYLSSEFLYPLFTYQLQLSNILQRRSLDAGRQYVYCAGADECALNANPTTKLVQPYPNKGAAGITAINREENNGKEYLRRIIELCRENEVEIMLTLSPIIPTEDEMELINSACEIAEENSVKLFNGIGSDVVDIETDFWDCYHMNSSGARKWSSAVGKYITENYELPDRSDGEDAQFWEKMYESVYMPAKAMRLVQQASAYNYLMLAADRELSVCIAVPDGSDFFADEELTSLLKNAVYDFKPQKLDNASASRSGYCLVADRAEGRLYELYPDDGSVETSFGSVLFKDGTLTVNGIEAGNAGENGESTTLFQAAVFAKRGGTPLDLVRFTESFEKNCFPIR